jgi:hypothetical protein
MRAIDAGVQKAQLRRPFCARTPLAPSRVRSGRRPYGDRAVEGRRAGQAVGFFRIATDGAAFARVSGVADGAAQLPLTDVWASLFRSPAAHARDRVVAKCPRAASRPACGLARRWRGSDRARWTCNIASRAAAFAHVPGVADGAADTGRAALRITGAGPLTFLRRAFVPVFPDSPSTTHGIASSQKRAQERRQDRPAAAPVAGARDQRAVVSRLLAQRRRRRSVSVAPGDHRRPYPPLRATRHHTARTVPDDQKSTATPFSSQSP